MKTVKGRFEDKAAFVRALHDVNLSRGPMGPSALTNTASRYSISTCAAVERKDGQLVNTSCSARTNAALSSKPAFDRLHRFLEPQPRGVGPAV